MNGKISDIGAADLTWSGLAEKGTLVRTSASGELANVAMTRNGSDLFPKGGWNMVRWSVAFLAVAFLIAQSGLAAQPSPAEMDELASDNACYLCHSAEPTRLKQKNSLPYAPSWQEIALMYRGQKDAEDRLTKVVLWGSGGDAKDRHWKGKVIELGMLPNVKEIDEDQARQLVRWILSFAP